MQGWHLLVILAGFFLGVIVESLYELPVWVIFGLSVSSWVFALLWRRSGSWQSLVVSVCLLLVCAGIVRAQMYESRFDESPLSDEVGLRVTIVGDVVSEPDERGSFTQVHVETESDVVLVRADRFADIAYGDRIEVVGKLEQPVPFDTDTGRVFDYPKYLQVRGVQYVISFASITVLESGRGSWLLSGLYSSKSYFMDSLARVVPSPEVDLGVGLLLGVKQALGDELEEAFRKTGIIHIVVLSGYNVMLVVGFFWWVSSWFSAIRGRIVFGLVGITLFALLVGLSATVVRASIMAAILLVGKWLGRLYDVLRALLFAAAVMVAINPYILLYDIGFQLSFMATLGLVLVLPRFESTVATGVGALRLRDLFMATVVTQIFVLPLLMYHIGEVSLVSVLVNMLVLPMVPVAMLATFVTGLVSLVSVQVGFIFGLVAQLPLTYISVIAERFASLPFAAVVIPEISIWVMLFMYAAIAAAYSVWIFKNKSGLDEHDPIKGWEVVEESESKTDLESNDSKSVLVPKCFR